MKHNEGRPEEYELDRSEWILVYGAVAVMGFIMGFAIAWMIFG